MPEQNGSFYDTVEGHKSNPSSIPGKTSTVSWTDPGIDTKREAQAYQSRIARLAGEASNPTNSAQGRAIAQREHDGLVKALPFQLAGWAEIDRRRGGR